MAKNFGNVKLPLTCGQCGHKFQQTVGRLETNPNVPCPKCGVLIRCHTRELRATLSKADQAIAKLFKGFKKPR